MVIYVAIKDFKIGDVNIPKGTTLKGDGKGTYSASIKGKEHTGLVLSDKDDTKERPWEKNVIKLPGGGRRKSRKSRKTNKRRTLRHRR